MTEISEKNTIYYRCIAGRAERTHSCPAERGEFMKRKALFAGALGFLMSGALLVTAVPVPAFAAEAQAGSGQTAVEAGSAAAETAGAANTAAQAAETTGAASTAVKKGYVHDPMENPKAAQDIIVNREAVYGYSPSPLSTRLREFVDIIDWTNEKEVAEARDKRIQYYETEEILYQTIETMLDENKSIEEIAREVSKKRNELRLAAYIGDPDGLERVKKSNLDTYGNEEGPTIDYLFEKYGSWEAVLQKALSSNPGMDACLGLYDDYYEFYGIEEKVQLKIKEEAVKTDEATGKKTYTVKKDDNLWKIAETIYGDGTKWNLIYEANKDVLDNPGDLRVGMELVIPEAPQKNSDVAAAAAKTE